MPLTYYLLFVSFLAIFRKIHSFLKIFLIAFNSKKNTDGITEELSICLHFFFRFIFFSSLWWMQQKIEPS